MMQRNKRPATNTSTTQKIIKKNDLMWKNIERAIEVLSLHPPHQQQGAKEQPLSLPKPNWVKLIQVVFWQCPWAMKQFANQ